MADEQALGVIDYSLGDGRPITLLKGILEEIGRSFSDTTLDGNFILVFLPKIKQKKE